MSRGRRAALVLGLTTATALAWSTSAAGCSCAPVNPRTALEQADAAFIGTPLRSRPATGRSIVVTYRVAEVLKGRLGETVDVTTGGLGSSCGLDPTSKTAIGLALERRGDHFAAGTCDEVDPDELREAARPRPAPDGSGPVRFVVPGDFGGVRLLALDARGRTLAYGDGDGTAYRVAVCPGGGRLVELHTSEFARDTSVTVRELPGLGVVRTRRVPSRTDFGVSRMVCRDARGDDIAVLRRNAEEGARSRVDVVRLVGSRTERLYDGPQAAGDLTQTTAFLASGVGSRPVVAVDLETGASRRVATAVVRTDSLEAREDGSLLALTSTRGERTLLTLLDLRAAKPRSRTVTPPTRSDLPIGLHIGWLANDRLVAAESDGGVGYVYDSDLRSVGGFGGWLGRAPAVDGSVAYGAGYGNLQRVALPRGPVRRVRSLPGDVTYDVAVVPAAARRHVRATLAGCHRTTH